MFYKVWSLLGPLYIKSKKCVVARLDNLCADSSLGSHLVNGKLCCFIHPKNANLKTYIQERILICINYILFHIHSFMGWLPLAEVRIGDQSHYQPSQSASSRRSGRKLNELLTVIIELSGHLLGISELFSHLLGISLLANCSIVRNSEPCCYRFYSQTCDGSSEGVILIQAEKLKLVETMV